MQAGSRRLALEDGAVWDKATSANFMDTLVAIFPSNMWKSFTDANMLQVIVIALMFGGGILAAGEKGKLAQGPGHLTLYSGHRPRDGLHHCPQPHRRFYDDDLGRRHVRAPRSSATLAARASAAPTSATSCTPVLCYSVSAKRLCRRQPASTSSRGASRPR